MNLLPLLLAVSPNPGLDHPQPQRLTAERDPVDLAQLLSRQGRTKVPVPLANDRQRLRAKRLRLAPVTRTTTPLRDQARRSFDPVRNRQGQVADKYLHAARWTYPGRIGYEEETRGAAMTDE
jgi:hypothetical protein